MKTENKGTIEPNRP